MLDKEKVLSSLQDSYNFYTGKSIDSESDDEAMIYARYSIATLEIMNGIKTGYYDISQKPPRMPESERQRIWESSTCGDFSIEGSTESSFKFCPRCGKPIEEIKDVTRE